DGMVALSPAARSTEDPVVEELIDMYRLAQGEHPDWAEFRQAMVSEGRVVATLSASSAYGMLGA
ncbi:MAG: PPOX class F420-dependent oxidoreductase, partial [Mycobacterium sp.]